MSLSHFFLFSGAAQLECAGHVRHAATCLDFTAPLIDVARRCASMDFGGADVCAICKITKHDFDKRDLTAQVHWPS